VVTHYVGIDAFLVVEALGNLSLVEVPVLGQLSVFLVG